jgi:hypothetical protein
MIIIASLGCDAVIFESALQLQKAGIVKIPNPWSTLYRGLNIYERRVPKVR